MPSDTTETATDQTEPAFEPITSQEQFDAATKTRIDRAEKRITAKFADYEQLKLKAAELDTLKTASMTQAEKDVARIRELESEIIARDQALAAERHAGLRRDVAAAKGVPHDKITGETREQLEASADELLEWRKTAEPRPRPAIGNLRSGASNTENQMDKKERAATMLRELYGGRH